MSKLVIVTDEPAKYEGVVLGEGVTVHHRDELDRIQRELKLAFDPDRIFNRGRLAEDW